jgi:hypothetical protein
MGCRRFFAHFGGMAGVAILSGCLKAATAPAATSLRVENAMGDSVAVWVVETGVATRSLVSFEPGLLTSSVARNGIVAPGTVREFEFDSIAGYESGASVSMTVLRVRGDSVSVDRYLEMSDSDLRSAGFRIKLAPE